MRNAIITTFYIFAASAPLRALAEVEYRLSAPLPGGGSNQVVSGKESFVQYIEFLFPFLLSAAAILALVMFIYGAMTYMIAGGNPQKLGDAKGRMVSALMGLLLAVSSVLILKTINPQLVELKLSLQQVGSMQTSATCRGGSFDANGCPSGSQCVVSVGTYKCRSTNVGTPSGQAHSNPDQCEAIEETYCTSIGGTGCNRVLNRGAWEIECLFP